MTDAALYSAGLSREGTGTVSDYVELLKPRVMTLVVFSGIAGLYMAPGHLHPFLSLVAIACIAIGSGAAGAINMWYDRDIDARMSRTQGRPVPQGRIHESDALAFGLVLLGLSVALMGLALNWAAACLLAFAAFFYVVVYTMWLKRTTPQNIVIGGAAGAFPPMIGWAAVTGGVSVESIVLFLLIFMWTPPHFWALALYKNEDYRRAGVPMMPVVAGPLATKRQMVLYTALLFPLAVAPYALHMAGFAYLAGAVSLTAIFFIQSLRVLRDSGDRSARQMFGYSIFYLFAVFALLMADKL